MKTEQINTMSWIKTSERAPTEEDAADTFKLIFALESPDNFPHVTFWDDVKNHPVKYPKWMPIPPLLERTQDNEGAQS